MKTRIFTFGILAALFANIGCAIPADPKYTDFKSKWSSSVTKTVTVAGILIGGKLGYFLKYENWGFDVYAASDKDLAKLNTLSPLVDKRVVVTGVLRFNKGYIPAGTKPATGVPEHFYFDIAEVEISAAPTATHTKPNQTVDPTTTAVTPPAGQEPRHQ